MTDFVRKETDVVSEGGRVLDPHPPHDLTERTLGPDADSRTLVTPPPLELPSVSVASGSTTATAAIRAQEEERIALFTPNEANDLRARWDSIQVGFVDEPRKAVEEADALVSATMKRLGEVFADERQKLEQQWDRRENISTEDFRVTLRRYRSFFGRLLAI
jgi:hypothetical protein